MRGTGLGRHEVAWRYLLLAMMFWLIGAFAGCANVHESKDYERHRYSQIVTPFDRNDVVFVDVKFDPRYPDNNAAAEQQRMQWIAAWLEARQLCGDGFEIAQRRPFGDMENNPARYDIRYEVKCTSATGG